LASALFKSGTRMFEHFGDGHKQLELLKVIGSLLATHLRYLIIKRD
jgi:hypothetical protein